MRRETTVTLSAGATLLIALGIVWLVRQGVSA